MLDSVTGLSDTPLYFLLSLFSHLNDCLPTMNRQAVLNDIEESFLQDAMKPNDAHMDVLANISIEQRSVLQPDFHSSLLFKDSNGTGIMFTSTILGQITSGYNTKVRATGNNFGDNVITDASKIYFILGLTCPTDASDGITDVFTNQLNVLGRAYNMVINSNKNPNTSSFVKAGVGHWDIIPLATRRIYDVSTTKKLTPYSFPAASSRRAAVIAARTGNAVPNVRVPSPPPAEREPDPNEPITLSTRYKPATLPDYEGSLFQLEKARLVQLNVVDANNELIPPPGFRNTGLNWYTALIAGSIVLARVHLCAWSLGNEPDPKKRAVRCQIVADHIKVRYIPGISDNIAPQISLGPSPVLPDPGPSRMSTVSDRARVIGSPHSHTPSPITRSPTPSNVIPPSPSTRAIKRPAAMDTTDIMLPRQARGNMHPHRPRASSVTPKKTTAFTSANSDTAQSPSKKRKGKQPERSAVSDAEND